MSLPVLFLAYCCAVGVAVGAAYVEFPAMQAMRVPAYLVVLIALAVFDVACMLRGGGMVTMPIRFAGFGLGLAAMMLVLHFTGTEVTYF